MQHQFVHSLSLSNLNTLCELKMTIKSYREVNPLFSARVAGLLYLMIIVFGVSSELLVRAPIIDFTDPVATARNISNNESLFRFGFLADTIMLMCDIALAVVFYVLFRPVNEPLSLLAAAFRLTQAVILSVNLLFYYSAILLLSKWSYFSLQNDENILAMATFVLDIHSHGYDLGLIFFSLSNFILAYLIIKSQYIPRVFGYGLLAAAIVYLAGSYTRFMLPSYIDTIQVIYLLPLIAELALSVYLLSKGLRYIQ
mgnify:CR=1 FL=1